ncbi:MAG TPA: succinylglutamate desuccinylase/aspartoacylase family protein [bacterium]|nr:succinylglutamate desuccinylase/aspartoacylase family protein [bacterium]
MVRAKVKYLTVKTKKLPEYKMAYWEIDSGKKGPCFLVTAAIHGNEVQGSEAIRRFCPIAEKKIVKGKMFLVPFVNPLALWNRRPHIVSTLGEPFGREEKDNLNRTWPGDPDGNESEQVAYVFFNKFFKKIAPTHYIDLHCYNRFTLACSLADEKHPESIKFAEAAAFPIRRTFSWDLVKGKDGDKGTSSGKLKTFSLPEWVRENGGTAFAVEFSGQYAITEKEVQRGVRMLCNCAKYTGMFRGRLEGMNDKPLLYREGKNTVWASVRAPVQGLFAENGWTNGDFVRKGDLLGTLFDDRTLKTIKIKAPMEGYLYLYGSTRKRCDVDLASMHPYADKDGVLASIIGEKKTKKNKRERR